MTHAELEHVYEALAKKLDHVGEAKSQLFLAKLALLLAKEIGSVPPTIKAIDAAAKSLDV